MNAVLPMQPEIEAREKLDFKLDKTIPKYWFNNDPFKTRLIDGLQLTFPDGERYFITSVRPYRDQTNDEKLKRDIKDFIRQEAQHGIAHSQYNEILESQGIPVKELLDEHIEFLEGLKKRYSQEFNLTVTAASEHFTALMAEAFFSKKEVLEGVDKRMKTLLAWHCIEEMEHRSVAFNTMKDVAKTSYFKRSLGMVVGSFLTAKVMITHTNKLLEADGFTRRERLGLWAKNIGWMYGKNGVFSSFNKPMIDYFKPSFHPEDIPVVHNYNAWLEAYNETQDPEKACDALMQAAH